MFIYAQYILKTLRIITKTCKHKRIIFAKYVLLEQWLEYCTLLWQFGSSIWTVYTVPELQWLADAVMLPVFQDYTYMENIIYIHRKHYTNSLGVTFRLLGCWRTSMTCLRRSSLSLRLLYSIWLVSSVWCCKRMSSARVFWMVVRCLNSSSCMDSWCRSSMACSRSFCVCRLFNSFKMQRRGNHQSQCGESDNALLLDLSCNFDRS